MQNDSAQTIYRHFGEIVRSHRKAREYTQEHLARLVGLSRTSITNIERGRQHILLHQAFAIAHALNVPIETLLPPGDWDGDSWVAARLPPGTAKGIKDWARNLR